MGDPRWGLWLFLKVKKKGRILASKVHTIVAVAHRARRDSRAVSADAGRPHGLSSSARIELESNRLRIQTAQTGSIVLASAFEITAFLTIR